METIYSMLIIFLINCFATATASEKVNSPSQIDEATPTENVKNHFGYASLGVKGYALFGLKSHTVQIVPNPNLGYRIQQGHFGLDSSAGLSAIDFDDPILALKPDPFVLSKSNAKRGSILFWTWSSSWGSFPKLESLRRGLHWP